VDELESQTHETAMRRAIRLAVEAVELGLGGPFGAVIVREGKIVAVGQNRVTSAADPTAHAEIVAIRAACEALDTHQLSGCVIYSSCEPCPMCLAAIEWARLDRLYFAATREDAAAAGFDDARLYEELARPPRERSLPTDTLLGEEALVAFRAWGEKDDRVLCFLCVRETRTHAPFTHSKTSPTSKCSQYPTRSPFS